ncbi:MAG: hypothetical protein AB8G99_18645 [Planctomycetaceae bacterium]
MNYVPERWQPRFDAYLRDSAPPDIRKLSAADFRYHVTIRLADGSHAVFHHAFYLIDRELNEVAVFTEHCGYHYFPLRDSTIELLECVRTDVGTD